MKGMYVIWPDQYYINKMIAAGTDTLIVGNLDYPNEEVPAKHWGAWDETRDTLATYQNHPKLDRLVFAPVWVQYWKDLPQNQAFYDGTHYRLQTPCPTSEAFVKGRLEQAVKIANRFNAFLAIDFEHYAAKPAEVNGVLKIFAGNGQQACHCQRCQSLSTKEQYRVLANNIEKYLRPYKKDTIYYYPYNPKWFHKLFPKRLKKVFMCEDMYEGKAEFKEKIKSLYYKWRYGVKTVAGIWTEEYEMERESDLLDSIDDFHDSFWFSGGVWLYPIARLSRNSWVHTKPNYAKNANFLDRPTELLTDSFFDKLSRIF